jgi:hypothetical protein
MSDVIIPQTEAEQYFAIKDMMASNLCTKGVFALPTDSLAQLASKILNIKALPFVDKPPCIVRFQQSGTISTSSTSNASVSSAAITLAPPTGTNFDWGDRIGVRSSVASDYRLLSAVIRSSWYSGTGRNEYNSLHFISAEGATSILDETTWLSSWQYRVVNRPYYNGYPDTSFNTSGSTTSTTRGSISFSLYPYSNSTAYNYWNPNYLSLQYINWIVKRPVT